MLRPGLVGVDGDAASGEGRGEMSQSGTQPLLGAVLVQQGEVTREEVEKALATQVENGERLGKILLEWSAVSSPALDRALAQQNGVELHLEGGFGTGLRAAIERRHRLRRAALV
jgi:hypothetical protein